MSTHKHMRDSVIITRVFIGLPTPIHRRDHPSRSCTSNAHLLKAGTLLVLDISPPLTSNTYSDTVSLICILFSHRAHYKVLPSSINTKKRLKVTLPGNPQLLLPPHHTFLTSSRSDQTHSELLDCYKLEIAILALHPR